MTLELMTLSFLLLVTGSAGGEVVTKKESACFGKSHRGALRNGWKLPSSGPNFGSYSTIGNTLGRTYVHSKVHRVIVDAYAALAKKRPKTTFVYGETGFEEGGKFRPHRTHQNGLSVDFMVPVLNSENQSVSLPTNALNKWGYSIEFDLEGRHKDLRIDFESIVAHLDALLRAAQRHKVRIKLVIFDPKLQPFLRKTSSWSNISGKIRFSRKRVWVRHDDHYHVDFSVPCRKLRAQ